MNNLKLRNRCNVGVKYLKAGADKAEEYYIHIILPIEGRVAGVHQACGARPRTLHCMGTRASLSVNTLGPKLYYFMAKPHAKSVAATRRVQNCFVTGSQS